MSVILETTLGDITLDLYITKRKLTQTGDPTNNKTGGDSIFNKLLQKDSYKYVKLDCKPPIKHIKGHVSMVNNGKNEFGSQFFITIGDSLSYLDNKHLVFGCVTEGLDVLSKLNDTLCDDRDQPYQDVWLNHTIILSDPFEDPPTLRQFMPDSSPLPSYKHLFSERISINDEIKEENEKDVNEKLEKEKDKAAKTRAKILEIVGDLPKASIKPKENILFVCKLNPITVSKDLKIIFARFGNIKSCEIVYDKLTGNSLGYGFVEYEKVENCEQAYLTMENVLIDDRRIHVDFCQSVHQHQKKLLKKHTSQT
ncbi:unnamed protein product [Gordionus sp. m RMFG-2023]|uniref:peptidyl-prolyl cis-trans isomerase-like 4 isoform X2 n=1 Tax=Gordionus sp. m RMFG-2023 TaxID=3053472 RepID=UPI0030E3EE34